MNLLKKIICIALYLNLSSVYSQSEGYKKYLKETIEDTFKNESVLIVKDIKEVVITPYLENDYKISNYSTTQYKIKDMHALERFSTIYEAKGIKKINYNIIKPDGKVKEIFKFEDKEYKDEKAESAVNFRFTDKEIAVENLEIGDIVEYKFEWSYTTVKYMYEYKETKNPNFYYVTSKNYNLYKTLPKDELFLQKSYPTLGSMLIYTMPNELDLVQHAIKCNYKFEKNSSGKKTYTLKTGQEPAFKSEYFSYDYISYPVVKYAIVQNKNNEKGNAYPYQFTSSKVSYDDIATLGRRFYKDPRFMPKYLYYINTTPTKKPIKEVSLNKFFSSFLKTFIQKDETDKIEIVNKLHEYLTNNDEVNTWQFKSMNQAVILARFCDKIKLPYKMVACLKKNEGVWENVVSPTEINWGILLEKDGEKIFAVATGKSENIYLKYGSLAGTEVVVFDPKLPSGHETETYPETKYTENRQSITSEINIEDAKKNSFHFINTYQYLGVQRYNLNENIENKFGPSELKTPSKFAGLIDWNMYDNEIFKDTGDILPEYRRINSSFGKYIEDYNKSSFEGLIYDEYGSFDFNLDSFKLFKEGVFADNQTDTSDCGFKVEFDVKNLFEESANNMAIIHLGKLITSQLDIENFKINERIGDVYNTNLRQFETNITLELPKGYKTLNLDDFNNNFENAAGIFKTEATLKGNTIILKTLKIYKTNYLPKDKWIEMIEFLKKAAIFFDKKLVLEKI